MTTANSPMSTGATGLGDQSSTNPAAAGPLTGDQSRLSGLYSGRALIEPVLRDAASPQDGEAAGVESYDEGTDDGDEAMAGSLPGVEPVPGYQPNPLSELGAAAPGAESADADMGQAVDADFASDETGRQEFFGALIAALPTIVRGGQAISRIPAVRRAGQRVLRRVGIESEGLPPEDASLLEVVLGTDDRVQINATTAKPWSGICQLNITSRTGRRYVGTGWMISPRCVVTAGHCVYLHGAGGWAQTIEVCPGRNGTRFPYGRINATSFRAITQWTRDSDRNYDFGCIFLPEAPKGPGGLPFCYNFGALSDAEIRGRALNLSGYPGDKGSTTQWFHARMAKGVSAFTIDYDIDTAGGQSGSPVWHLSGGTRTAVGIHTNGSPLGNSATRITPAVSTMLQSWKSLVS